MEALPVEPCRDPHSGGRIFSIFKALKENLPHHYAINLRVLHAGDESFNCCIQTTAQRADPFINLCRLPGGMTP